jgi:hypothetical protein
MIPPYFLPAAVPVVLLLICLRAIIRRCRAHTLSQLPGPPAGSWLVGNTAFRYPILVYFSFASTGNLPDLFRPENAAEAEFSWTEKYGSAIRIKGAWGVSFVFARKMT